MEKSEDEENPRKRFKQQQESIEIFYDQKSEQLLVVKNGNVEFKSFSKFNPRDYVNAIVTAYLAVNIFTFDDPEVTKKWIWKDDLKWNLDGLGLHFGELVKSFAFKEPFDKIVGANSTKYNPHYKVDLYNVLQSKGESLRLDLLGDVFFYSHHEDGPTILAGFSSHSMIVFSMGIGWTLSKLHKNDLKILCSTPKIFIVYNEDARQRLLSVMPDPDNPYRSFHVHSQSIKDVLSDIKYDKIATTPRALSFALINVLDMTLNNSKLILQMFYLLYGVDPRVNGGIGSEFSQREILHMIEVLAFEMQFGLNYKMAEDNFVAVKPHPPRKLEALENLTGICAANAVFIILQANPLTEDMMNTLKEMETEPGKIFFKLLNGITPDMRSDVMKFITLIETKHGGRSKKSLLILDAILPLLFDAGESPSTLAPLLYQIIRRYYCHECDEMNPEGHETFSLYIRHNDQLPDSDKFYNLVGQWIQRHKKALEESKEIRATDYSNGNEFKFLVKSTTSFVCPSCEKMNGSFAEFVKRMEFNGDPLETHTFVWKGLEKEKNTLIWGSRLEKWNVSVKTANIFRRENGYGHAFAYIYQDPPAAPFIISDTMIFPEFAEQETRELIEQRERDRLDDPTHGVIGIFYPENKRLPFFDYYENRLVRQRDRLDDYNNRFMEFKAKKLPTKDAMARLLENMVKHYCNVSWKK